MIVHSSYNIQDGTCQVKVEGIEAGRPETDVVVFATGAAAAHNPSYQVRQGRVVEWLDDDGDPITPDRDTAFATRALVSCRIENGDS